MAQNLNQSVIRTDYCTFAIPEVQRRFHQYPTTNELATTEGLILSSKEKLEELQPLCRVSGILRAFSQCFFAWCRSCLARNKCQGRQHRSTRSWGTCRTCSS